MPELSIHQKLVAIQSELKAPKSQMNTFGKYKYRSCEDILEAVKPIANGLGCDVLLSDEMVIVQSNDQLIVYETDEVISIYDKETKKSVQTIVHLRKTHGEPSRFYIKATATLSDDKGSISVPAFAREEREKKGMDGAQITGAASSYARKYALNGLFCIDDTKDADATNDHGKAPKEPNKATPDQLKTIAELAEGLDTSVKTIYESMTSGSVPTYDQALQIIPVLKAKLNKKLDATV